MRNAPTMRLAFEEALKADTPLTPLQTMVVEALRKPIIKRPWMGKGGGR